MDIKALFNIILLSITVTTILITIISFIIFKIRQLNVFQTKSSLHVLESAFFHRHAPHLETKNVSLLEEESKKRLSQPKRQKRNWSLGILITFLIILTAFFFEDHFNYRRAIQRRVATAKEYRGLVKDGMLRSYKYSNSALTPKLIPKISNQGSQQLRYIAKELKKKNFCIYKNARFTKTSNLAIKSWVSFFKRHSINYKKYSKIGSYNCAWVFPQITHITPSQLEVARKLFAKVPSIVTGSFAQFYKNGKDHPDNFLLDQFSINLITPDKKIGYNSLIITGKGFGWDINSGLMANWTPLVSKKSAYMTNSPSGLIVSDYSGSPLKLEKQYLSRNYVKDRFLWTSLDPQNTKHSDLIISYYFAKILSIPTVRISPWPNKRNSIVSIVTTMSDPLYSYSHFTELINRFKLPHTLFTNMEELRGLIDLIPKELEVEYALRSLPEDRLSENTKLYHFKFFEQKRLDLEEFGRKPVLGHTPSDGNYTNKILNGVSQNKIKYLYGGKRFPSHTPSFIKGAGFIYLAAMNKSLLALSKDSTIVTKENFLEKLRGDTVESQKLNSHYILKLENSILKNPILKSTLIDYFSESDPSNFSTISKIVNWKNLRQKLNISIQVLPNETIKVVVINKSDQDMYDFSFFFDHYLTEREVNIKSLMVDEQRVFMFKKSELI